MTACRINKQVTHTQRLMNNGTLEGLMVVQWLRLCAPKAEVIGSILGGGTRSHMPQLRLGTDK